MQQLLRISKSAHGGPGGAPGRLGTSPLTTTTPRRRCEDGLHARLRGCEPARLPHFWNVPIAQFAAQATVGWLPPLPGGGLSGVPLRAVAQWGQRGKPSPSAGPTTCACSSPRRGAEVGRRGWSGYTTQPFRLLVKCMTTPSCHDHPFHDVDGEAWHGCGSTSPAAPRVAGVHCRTLNWVGSAAGIPVEIVVNNIVSQVTIYGVGRRVGLRVFLRCPLTRAEQRGFAPARPDIPRSS